MEKHGHCFSCSKVIYIECGKCYAILMYLGQKHNCPDIDDGFFDDCDESVQLCDTCSTQRTCCCCGAKIVDSTICAICEQ